MRAPRDKAAQRGMSPDMIAALNPLSGYPHGYTAGGDSHHQSAAYVSPNVLFDIDPGSNPLGPIPNPHEEPESDDEPEGFPPAGKGESPHGGELPDSSAVGYPPAGAPCRCYVGVRPIGKPKWISDGTSKHWQRTGPDPKYAWTLEGAKTVPPFRAKSQWTYTGRLRLVVVVYETEVQEMERVWTPSAPACKCPDPVRFSAILRTRQRVIKVLASRGIFVHAPGDFGKDAALREIAQKVAVKEQDFEEDHPQGQSWIHLEPARATAVR